jgi:hypothetical protein
MMVSSKFAKMNEKRLRTNALVTRQHRYEISTK